jgi:hypothetical protein
MNHDEAAHGALKRIKATGMPVAFEWTVLFAALTETLTARQAVGR